MVLGRGFPETVTKFPFTIIKVQKNGVPGNQARWASVATEPKVSVDYFIFLALQQKKDTGKRNNGSKVVGRKKGREKTQVIKRKK